MVRKKKERNPERFYVYIYYEPLKGRPFYIGKGCNDRCFDHLLETKENNGNIFKWRKIQAIIRYGSYPIILKHIENLTEEEAYTLETSLIVKWGRKGIDPDGILTNRLLDSRPPTNKGCKFTDEHKQKLSEAYWKRVSEPDYVHPCKGKLSPIDAETWVDIRQASREAKAAKAKPKSALTPEERKLLGIEKSRKTRTGMKQTEEHKKVRANAISNVWKIITPTGEAFFIRNRENWCNENGIAVSSFRLVIRGKNNKRASGYTVQKVDKNQEIVITEETEKQIDIFKNLLKINL